jgi:hypothetical protein
MFKLRLLAAGTLFSALAVLSPASAQEGGPKCGPRADLVKVLTDKYHEVPIAIGMVDDKLIMETFASNTGTWTMFFTNAEGTSCMVSAGKDWQFDTSAFDDAKKGEAM